MGGEWEKCRKGNARFALKFFLFIFRFGMRPYKSYIYLPKMCITLKWPKKLVSWMVVLCVYHLFWMKFGLGAKIQQRQYRMSLKCLQLFLTNQTASSRTPCKVPQNEAKFDEARWRCRTLWAGPGDPCRDNQSPRSFSNWPIVVPKTIILGDKSKIEIC